VFWKHGGIPADALDRGWDKEVVIAGCVGAFQGREDVVVRLQNVLNATACSCVDRGRPRASIFCDLPVFDESGQV
jgi:hypothetical protein